MATLADLDMDIAYLLTATKTWSADAFCSVFPQTCLGCERPLPGSGVHDHDDRVWGQEFCAECAEQIGGSDAKRCPYCSAEVVLPPGNGGRCRLCRNVNLYFNSAQAIGNYQGLLQRLVLRMKAERSDILAVQLGRALARIWRRQAHPTMHGIVPVPISRGKRWQRCFNLAAAIADGFQQELRWPILENGLELTRVTKKQGTLSTPQRFENVRNAFGVVNRHAIAGRRLLIIDDVMTSGATMAEISRVLLSAGASGVWAAVIARGVRH